jgi:succinate dehydrogenase/fumarate reductase flavoprotein subunit
VHSARRQLKRSGAAALCGLLVSGALAGCTTTQETAARKQAESKRILERHERKRERRQARREKGAG